MEDEEDKEHEIFYVEVKESAEDIMYRNMMRISMDFFGRTK
jgi:hypothetical protein